MIRGAVLNLQGCKSLLWRKNKSSIYIELYNNIKLCDNIDN